MTTYFENAALQFRTMVHFPDSDESALARAFVTAHLLTGTLERAERVVLKVIESSDPDDLEESMFDRVVRVATSGAGEVGAGSSGGCLPMELQAVLRLSGQLRQAFVLRILVGLSRETCAGMLYLSPERVDECTYAAIRCLPFLTGDYLAACQD